MCEQWDSNVRQTIDFRKDQDMTTDHSLITHTDPSDPPNPTRNHPTWPFLHFMTFYTIQTKYFLKTHGTHWLLTVSQEKSQPLSGLRPLLWHSALVMFWTTRVTLNYKLVKKFYDLRNVLQFSNHHLRWQYWRDSQMINDDLQCFSWSCKQSAPRAS